MPQNELLQALEHELGADYQGRQYQDHFELAAELGPQQISTSARRQRHMTFMSSGDGLRLLGCGDQLLTVHVLAPYPGWENFREATLEAVGALPEETRSNGVSSIGLRYIDQIMLPPDKTELTDYFTIVPTLPPEMPPQLRGFHWVTLTTDPEDGLTTHLTVAGAPGRPGERPVLFDLTVEQGGNPLCSLVSEDWITKLDELHVRLRDIFESAITETTRELFQ